VKDGELYRAETRHELAAFEAAIEGSVVLADSPDYELVRKPPWAQFEDIRPAAVVVCKVPADVAETVAFARRVGIETVVRSGGHCFAGRSSTRGILIDVGPMRSMSVVDGIAMVGAGALLGDIYEHLDALGVTIAAGACPSVGIAGLTLGGGLGILGRKYGLTSDQLVQAQVVLADGRVVECDEQRDPDLFWALRGAGGGHFGVVTSFAFRTVPADDVTCFKLVWPYTYAVAAIDVWQTWAPSAADEVAASLLLNASGDLDEPVVTLFGAMLAGKRETESWVEKLVVRVGSGPESADLQQMTHSAAKRYLAEHAPGAEGTDETSPADPSQPSMMFAKSEFFPQPLPSEAIAALIEVFAAERATGQARELDFTPWGGAYNRTRPEATAFVHRRESFLLKHAVALEIDSSKQERDAGRDWLTRSWAIAHPWGSGGVFPNFPDADLADWAQAYHGANYDRLTRVKATYDPDNVFRFHQSLPPLPPSRERSGASGNSR
jgi:FAD/FMN-containing dehydrogenase